MNKKKYELYCIIFRFVYDMKAKVYFIFTVYNLYTKYYINLFYNIKAINKKTRIIYTKLWYSELVYRLLFLYSISIIFYLRI